MSRNKLVFEIDDAIIKVKVMAPRDCGVYQFRNVSSTGKSRLCKILKDYETTGRPVAGYDYYDFKHNVDLEAVKGNGIKLIVLDRYDMYNGELADTIRELSKEALVLLDCKTFPELDIPVLNASISMDEDCIYIDC